MQVVGLDGTAQAALINPVSSLDSTGFPTFTIGNDGSTKFLTLRATKTLVNATPTPLFTVAVPVGTHVYVSVSFLAMCHSAASFQSHCGIVSALAHNRTGTPSLGVADVNQSEITLTDAGTFADAWSATASPNLITVRASLNSSLPGILFEEINYNLLIATPFVNVTVTLL